MGNKEQQRSKTIGLVNEIHISLYRGQQGYRLRYEDQGLVPFLLYFMRPFLMFNFYVNFQANETFTSVYSGGRDKLIYKCETRAPDKYVLLCQESAPVLKMLLTPDNSSLYVATTNSAIRCWVNIQFF